jgi:hypothetical protein
VHNEEIDKQNFPMLLADSLGLPEGAAGQGMPVNMSW